MSAAAAAPIPAPEGFVDLRAFLHNAGIDAAFIRVTLDEYLFDAQNLPRLAWFDDPVDEHQAWAYREAIQTFRDMIADAPDEGNGEG